LRDRGILVDDRDMAKRPLTAAELDRLIGERPVTDFLNPRNELFRERSMQQNPPARAETIRLMAENPNLIRRPLLVLEERILFGFDAAEYAAVAS
jgi:arsenate reductase-like glutaredoxin family protein